MPKLKPIETSYDVVDRGHETPCWVWNRHIDKDGYGGGMPKPNPGAHRYVYALMVGPIPDGLQIDHLCRVRACVNPEHMEPVTHAENMRRSFHAQKTHCQNGHGFSPENTYQRPKDGVRQCRACNASAARRYAARKSTLVSA